MKVKKNYIELDLRLVKNPICRGFFTLIRIFGTIITVCALVGDYAYAFKQTFSSKQLFAAYLGVLAFRCILPFLVAFKNVCLKVCHQQNNKLGADAYAESNDAESVEKK